MRYPVILRSVFVLRSPIVHAVEEHSRHWHMTAEIHSLAWVLSLAALTVRNVTFCLAVGANEDPEH